MALHFCLFYVSSSLTNSLRKCSCNLPAQKVLSKHLLCIVLLIDDCICKQKEKNSLRHFHFKCICSLARHEFPKTLTMICHLFVDDGSSDTWERDHFLTTMSWDKMNFQDKRLKDLAGSCAKRVRARSEFLKQDSLANLK